VSSDIQQAAMKTDQPMARHDRVIVACSVSRRGRTIDAAYKKAVREGRAFRRAKHQLSQGPSDRCFP